MGERRLNGVLRRLRGLAHAGDAEAGDAELLRRFTAGRDEAAFEALVRRHGPMVWGVCRRVLRGSHDAEDAFQATFLVLVRKAASVARPDLLGNWLYGVACRTAREARAAAARRRLKEREAGAMPRDDAAAPEPWREALPLLDRELSRLPAKYRIPIVLCDLQGASRRDAARRLKLPEGTLSSRLARGRVLLARRLARRGAAVSGGALAAALAADAAKACVPPLLTAATVRAAVLFATGPAAGAVSAHAAALTQGVLKAMLWTKLMTAAAFAMAAALLAAGAAAVAWRGDAARAEAAKPAAAAAAAPDDKEPAAAEKPDDDAAAARGLKWLALHQAPDGHWSLHEFQKFAHKDPALDSKTFEDACTGQATAENDAAGTAFGVLPFLAAGCTHRPSKEKHAPDPAYAKNVKAALDWLLARQDKDGAFDAQSMYANALAAAAVCEAYGLTADPALKGPAQKAVQYVQAAQDPRGGGWRYQPRMPGDLSVTGWQLTALESARAAGLDVDKKVLRKADDFLDSCQTKTKGYSYVPEGPETASMTAVGLLCRQYLGANPRDAALRAGVEVLRASPPGKTENVYYEYYATLALSHVGGSDWKAWNEGADGKGGVRKELLAAQSRGADKKACEAGSWDPVGPWKAAGGRVMQTSLSLLMLEALNRPPPPRDAPDGSDK